MDRGGRLGFYWRRSTRLGLGVHDRRRRGDRALVLLGVKDGLDRTAHLAEFCVFALDHLSQIWGVVVGIR